MPSTCPHCGAPTSAETLDGLCIACVGRGILETSEEFSDVDSNQQPGEPVSSTSSFELEQKVGGRVGPYRLLRQIGEGGFGVVYLAEQLEPLKRQVALKIIKFG